MRVTISKNINFQLISIVLEQFVGTIAVLEVPNCLRPIKSDFPFDVLPLECECMPIKLCLLVAENVCSPVSHAYVILYPE